MKMSIKKINVILELHWQDKIYNIPREGVGNNKIQKVILWGYVMWLNQPTKQTKMISENQNPLHVYILKKAIDVTEMFPADYSIWIQVNSPYIVAIAASIYCLMARPSQSQVEGFRQETADSELRAGFSFVASLLKLSHMSPCSWITHVTWGTEAGSEGQSPGQIRVGLYPPWGNTIDLS